MEVLPNSNTHPKWQKDERLMPLKVLQVEKTIN